MKDFFKLYSQFIFGIGIGLLFAGLLIGAFPSELTEEQIEDMAREMGMVYKNEVVTYGSEGGTEDSENAGQESLGDEGNDSETVEIEIKSGMNLSEVGNMLKNKGVIEDEERFTELAERLHLSEKFIAGTYQISPERDMYDILLVITSLERGNEDD